MSRAEKVKQKLLQEITQAQIKDFWQRQLAVKTLKDQLKDEERILDALQDAYVGMLEKGYTFEPGDKQLVITTTSRTIVPWKEKFAEAMGPKAVEKILGETEPRQYKRIDVIASPFTS